MKACIHTTLFVIDKNQRRSKCPSTSEKPMVFTYDGISLSNNKEKQTIGTVSAFMNLKIIIWSERSWTTESIHNMILFI
jgi:hypothetical protein